MNSIEYLRDILKTVHLHTQPCEGHIDPDSIEDCWNEVFDTLNTTEKQLNNGWIPVSVRLPEESIDGITDDYVSYNVSLKFEHAECTRTYKFGGGKWWNSGKDMSKYVTAWQPLPEPFIR